MSVGLESPVLEQRVRVADHDILQRTVILDLYDWQQEAAVTEGSDTSRTVELGIAHRPGDLDLRFDQPLHRVDHRQVPAQQLVDIQLFDRGHEIQLHGGEGLSRPRHLYPAAARRRAVEKHTVGLFNQDLSRIALDGTVYLLYLKITPVHVVSCEIKAPVKAAARRRTGRHRAGDLAADILACLEQAVDY